MKRDSFVFYKSFYDSIKELDPKDQVQIYDAIFKYQFEGNDIELKGVCKSIFTLIIPQLEANNKRYINGCKGGAPKGNQNATKKQPKTTKKQPNDNDNVNDNVNENDNVIITTTIYEYIEQNFGRTLSPIEIQQIDEWLSIYEEEVIKYSISIATLNNKKTFNYVNGILKNWKSNGYKTLQEIKDNEITKKEIISEKNKEIQELENYNWLEEGVIE